MNNNLKKSLLSLNIFDDNKYLDEYVKLINDNKNNLKTNITQKHHIIPRYYYRENNLKVDNTRDNLINLKFSDHVKAHYLLYNCSKSDKLKFKNLYALKRMIGSNKIENDDYIYLDDIYKKYYEYNKKLNKGRHHETSEETKTKISKANKGKYKSHTYIHKDNVEKHIDKLELNYYLNNGWLIGRSDKTKENLSKGYNRDVKGMLGKKQSEKQKEAARKAASKPKSISAKANMRIARLDKKLVSNEITKHTLYVDKTKIEEYIRKGYHLGKLKER